MHWYISVTGRLNNVSGGGGAIELHDLNYVARTLLQWNTLELGGPGSRLAETKDSLIKIETVFVIKYDANVWKCGVIVL